MVPVRGLTGPKYVLAFMHLLLLQLEERRTKVYKASKCNSLSKTMESNCRASKSKASKKELREGISPPAASSLVFATTQLAWNLSRDGLWQYDTKTISNSIQTYSNIPALT